MSLDDDPLSAAIPLSTDDVDDPLSVVELHQVLDPTEFALEDPLAAVDTLSPKLSPSLATLDFTSDPFAAAVKKIRGLYTAQRGRPRKQVDVDISKTTKPAAKKKPNARPDSNGSRVSITTLAKDAAVTLRMGFFLTCCQLPARACMSHCAIIAKDSYRKMARALETCSERAGVVSNKVECLQQLSQLFANRRDLSRARVYCSHVYTEHEGMVSNQILDCKFDSLTDAQRQDLPSVVPVFSLVPILVWMWDETEQFVSLRICFFAFRFRTC
jgi:hypothetical protein